MRARLPDPESEHRTPTMSERDEGIDLESMPTSAADVESAGRSCLAILILVFAIVILVAIWFVVWSSS